MYHVISLCPPQVAPSSGYYGNGPTQEPESDPNVSEWKYFKAINQWPVVGNDVGVVYIDNRAINQ